MNVKAIMLFLSCRHQNSDSGGWNGTTETKADAKTKAGDRYCHAGTPVGLDQGEAPTSTEPETSQVRRTTPWKSCAFSLAISTKKTPLHECCLLCLPSVL